MKERRVSDDITDAYFELLKTKNPSDITTTEIIQKAGVCRASFYRHFYLPEDIIRQYGIALFREIDSTVPDLQNGVWERILAINTFFLTQRERLSLLERRGLFYLLEDPIVEHCRRQIQLMGAWHCRYQAEFYSGVTTHLTRAWIHNDFAESPQEITDIIYDLLRLKDLDPQRKNTP